MEHTSVAFLEHWISLFGFPKKIVSDQGKEFDNQLFKQISTFSGMTRNMTSPYHPMANGQAESSVKEVLRYARKFVEGNEWLPLLPNIRFAHNSAFNGSIKRTPYEAMFKKLPLLPGHIIDETRMPNYKDDVISSRLHHFATLRPQVMQESKTAFLQWKKMYDKKSKLRKFEPGDKIFVRSPSMPGQYHKFQQKFNGPFVVTNVSPAGNLEIIPYDTKFGHKRKIIHVNNARLAPAALQFFDRQVGPNENLNVHQETNRLRKTSPHPNSSWIQTGSEDDDVRYPEFSSLAAPDPVSSSSSSSDDALPSSPSTQSPNLSDAETGSDSTFHSPVGNTTDTTDSTEEEPEMPPAAPPRDARQTRSQRGQILSPSILSKYLPLRRRRNE